MQQPTISNTFICSVFERSWQLTKLKIPSLNFSQYLRLSLVLIFPLLIVISPSSYALEVKPFIDAKIDILTIEKDQLQAISERSDQNSITDEEKLRILDVHLPSLITNHLASLGMTYEELLKFEEEYALGIYNWLTFHLEEREKIFILQRKIAELGSFI